MAGRSYSVSGKPGSLQTPDRSEGEEKEKKKQKCAASQDEAAALFLKASGRSVSFSAGAIAHAEAMLIEGQAGQGSRNGAELPSTAPGGGKQKSFSGECGSVVASGTSSQPGCGDAAGKADGSGVDPDFDYDDEFWNSVDLAALDALVEETMAANARRRAEEAEMERRKGKAILTADSEDGFAAGGTRFGGGPSASFQSASSLPRDEEELGQGQGHAMAPTAAHTQPRGSVPMQAASNGASSSAGNENPGKGNLSSALHDIFFGAEGQQGNNRPAFPPAAFYAQGNGSANNAQRFRPPGRAVDARMQRRPAAAPAQPRAMLSRPAAAPAQPRAMPSRPAASNVQQANANFERGPAGPPLPSSQSRLPAVACGQSPAAFKAPRRK